MRREDYEEDDIRRDCVDKTPFALIWACVYLKALMRKPSNYWPLAHCPYPLDPAHGALGSDMHAEPAGRARPVALSFR